MSRPIIPRVLRGVTIDQCAPMHGMRQRTDFMIERKNILARIDIKNLVETILMSARFLEFRIRLLQLAICAELGVVRMKRQRDERLKAAGLVLQFAQLAQMIDAMHGLFKWNLVKNILTLLNEMLNGRVENGQIRCKISNTAG